MICMSEILLIIELKMGYARGTYGIIEIMLLSCILYIIAAYQLTIVQVLPRTAYSNLNVKVFQYVVSCLYRD